MIEVNVNPHGKKMIMKQHAVAAIVDVVSRSKHFPDNVVIGVSNDTVKIRWPENTHTEKKQKKPCTVTRRKSSAENGT